MIFTAGEIKKGEKINKFVIRRCCSCVGLILRLFPEWCNNHYMIICCWCFIDAVERYTGCQRCFSWSSRRDCRALKRHGVSHVRDIHVCRRFSEASDFCGIIPWKQIILQQQGSIIFWLSELIFVYIFSNSKKQFVKLSFCRNFKIKYHKIPIMQQKHLKAYIRDSRPQTHFSFIQNRWLLKEGREFTTLSGIYYNSNNQWKDNFPMHGRIAVEFHATNLIPNALKF